MAAELSPHLLSEKHRPTLDQALDAIRTRAYWSPHPEHPKAYGEGGAPGSLSAAEGKAAFDAVLNTRLDLGQPGTDGWTGKETSPYGPELGVEYPHADLDVLDAAERAYVQAWLSALPETRALGCLELIARIS
ncbi:phenylacetic acid degradation protein PaaN, partial [Streptomyces mirabilis]